MSSLSPDSQQVPVKGGICSNPQPQLEGQDSFGLLDQLCDVQLCLSGIQIPGAPCRSGSAEQEVVSAW
jgi:hypothetical protein